MNEVQIRTKLKRTKSRTTDMMTEYAVLMSVYYKEKAQYFKESLDSMASQTVQPTEFIIVCDGPLGDELNKVLNQFEEDNHCKFNIRIIRIEKCSGLGNALNVGMNMCDCDIIARMDSDDISKNNRIEMELKAMEENHADMVGSSLEEFSGTTDNIIALRKLPESHDDIVKFSRQRNPFNHPTMLLSKKAVINAGGYVPCQWFEDYYLWLRMLKSGAKSYNVQESLLFMRAGEDMYARRGGLSYGVTAIKFRWMIHKMGCSSLFDFIKSGFGQFLVSIVPNGCRIFFYKKLLRK